MTPGPRPPFDLPPNTTGRSKDVHGITAHSSRTSSTIRERKVLTLLLRRVALGVALGVAFGGVLWSVYGGEIDQQSGVTLAVILGGVRVTAQYRDAGGDMARRDRNRSRPPRDRIGDAALTCGVVALVFVFVPVMGDVITPPAAVTAVLLALVSLIRENRDLSAHSNRALAGGLLGAVAGLITVMVVAATGSLG